MGLEAQGVDLCHRLNIAYSLDETNAFCKIPGTHWNCCKSDQGKVLEFSRVKNSKLKQWGHLLQLSHPKTEITVFFHQKICYRALVEAKQIVWTLGDFFKP